MVCTLLGIVGYLLIGMGFAVYKWRRVIISRKTSYYTRRQSWLEGLIGSTSHDPCDHAAQIHASHTGDWSRQLKRQWTQYIRDVSGCDDKLKIAQPQVNLNKTRITSWVVCWVGVILWDSFIKFPIKCFGNFLQNLSNKLYIDEGLK